MVSRRLADELHVATHHAVNGLRAFD